MIPTFPWLPAVLTGLVVSFLFGLCVCCCKMSGERLFRSNRTILDGPLHVVEQWGRPRLLFFLSYAFFIFRYFGGPFLCSVFVLYRHAMFPGYMKKNHPIHEINKLLTRVTFLVLWAIPARWEEWLAARLTRLFSEVGRVENVAVHGSVLRLFGGVQQRVLDNAIVQSGRVVRSGDGTHFGVVLRILCRGSIGDVLCHACGQNGAGIILFEDYQRRPTYRYFTESFTFGSPATHYFRLSPLYPLLTCCLVPQRNGTSSFSDVYKWCEFTKLQHHSCAAFAYEMKRWFEVSTRLSCLLNTAGSLLDMTIIQVLQTVVVLLPCHFALRLIEPSYPERWS